MGCPKLVFVVQDSRSDSGGGFQAEVANQASPLGTGPTRQLAASAAPVASRGSNSRTFQMSGIEASATFRAINRRGAARLLLQVGINEKRAVKEAKSKASAVLGSG